MLRYVVVGAFFFCKKINFILTMRTRNIIIDTFMKIAISNNTNKQRISI